MTNCTCLGRGGLLGWQPPCAACPMFCSFHASYLQYGWSQAGCQLKVLAIELRFQLAQSRPGRFRQIRWMECSTSNSNIHSIATESISLCLQFTLHNPFAHSYRTSVSFHGRQFRCLQFGGSTKSHNMSTMTGESSLARLLNSIRTKDKVGSCAPKQH